MVIGKKAAVTISALSLVVGVGIGLGAASCAAPDVAPSPSETQSASPSPTAATATQSSSLKTQGEAKKKLDIFLEDVRRESAVFGATDSFEEKYKDSYTHLQQGTPQEDARTVIETFSLLFQMDPEAQVLTEEADFALEGDSARVKGSDFSLTVNGKTVDSSEDEGAGTLILTFADDQWFISKMEQ